MTLTTAVYKLGTAKVIKRVIMKSSLNEDEISISMKHPNIVNTYETFRTRFVDMNGNVQNLIWLVSEYIDGKITQKWVNRDETKIRMIMRDMLRALEYMHSKQVAHIDLKIANMMLKSRETDNVAKNEYSVPENSLDEDNYETKNKDKSKNERIGINNRPKKTLEDYYIGKLIDFGFSRRIDGNEVYVKHKAFGTYPYKPPEVIYENIHGFAGDIWCVGAIAWFLSLGKTPFYFENGEKDMDSFKRFLNGKPTVNKEYLAKGYRINKNMWFRRETSYELEDFIMKCMKRNRRRRPTVKELLEHDFIKNKKSVRTYEHDWFTTDESYSSSGSINMKL
ncbi:Calcium/calmodulin-dependent protein kinase II [Dictyocoela roeselum]|nr:Calcium/calmodulin-dependent protein kinase II [Dictyocoela roeselum]